MIYLVGENESRLRLVEDGLLHPDNIKQVSADALLAVARFQNDIVIVVDELREIEALKLSDRLANEQGVRVIDLRNNFVGLPVYARVLYFPEITQEIGRKILNGAWDELKATSDINKFALFKNEEVKTRKYDKVHYQDIEEELEDLRSKVVLYENTIADLKGVLQKANDDLDAKVDLIREKETELSRLKENEAAFQAERARLQETIRACEEREAEQKRIIEEISRKYDLVGFIENYRFEDRKRSLIREAKLKGKKIVGVVGTGESFIIKALKDCEDFIAVTSPDKADAWIVTTTPDPDAVQQFKEQVRAKPARKTIKVMTLWNESYPFTPESLVESSLDLVIPYDKEFFKQDWLGETMNISWRRELINLIQGIL